jgi:hypothetical protein
MLTHPFNRYLNSSFFVLCVCWRTECPQVESVINADTPFQQLIAGAQQYVCDVCFIHVLVFGITSWRCWQGGAGVIDADTPLQQVITCCFYGGEKCVASLFPCVIYSISHRLWCVDGQHKHIAFHHKTLYYVSNAHIVSIFNDMSLQALVLCVCFETASAGR